MSAEIIQLKPCANAPQALRNIAAMMESGEIEDAECTIIAGTDIFHCGEYDDADAATHAIFNMTMGIQKLMRPVIDG